MASSSRIPFKLDVLKTEALRRIDERIDEVGDKIAVLESNEVLFRAREAWETGASQSVFLLADELQDSEISDHEKTDLLRSFKIPPFPVKDQYEISALRRIELRLQSDRKDMVAKIASLAPSEDGIIMLTKTQLKEFFGLE